MFKKQRPELRRPHPLRHLPMIDTSHVQFAFIDDNDPKINNRAVAFSVDNAV
jgi:hypothetical protein